jgi:hypothetical protein
LSHIRAFVLPPLRRIIAAEGNPWRRGGEDGLQSGFAENPGDLGNGNPVDLGDLANRHAVFYQDADAGKLRPRNLARRLWLTADRSFELLVANCRRRRDYSQHTRFARRLVARSRVRNWWLADWWFRCEQCFGGLARSGDPLAIIAVRMRLLLSAKQDLLRKVDFVRDYRPDDS